MKPIDLHLINAEAKFKEAINHAYDLGWDASQERIIKLLEEWFADGDNYQEPTSKLFALIKGEK